jgi:hypothetical protein
VIFAERLDRHGDVVERVKIERFPFHVGRGYRNDWILDDPHVCPEHAVIEQAPDGSLVLRDLASRNGLLQEGRRVAELLLGGEAQVELGRTRLRLRDQEFRVPGAFRLRRRHRLVTWLFEHWSSPLAVSACVVAVVFFAQWQNTWSETRWSEWLMAPLVSLASLAFWSGGWALATRFLRQRSRFPAHMAVAGLLLLASLLSDELLQLARFLVARIAPVQWTGLAVTALLAAALIYGHLRVATVGGVRQRALAAGIAGGLFFGVQSLQQVDATPDWVSVLPYWSRLEPLPASWLPSASVEEFFAATQPLDAELEELAEE